MLYVARIDSTIKVGVEDMDLGPKVLITGPNESGKSTVVDAITLALGGFLYDAAGREIIRDNNVLVRMSGDPKRLISQAVLSDGQKSTYSVTRTKKGAGKDRGARPVPARFPFQEVREHLRSSPENLRKWLLRSMGSVLTEATLLASLSPTSQEVWRKLSNRVEGDELVDRFLAAIDEAKSTVKAQATATKTALETIDALAQGLGPRPDEATLEQLRQTITTLQAQLPRVIAAEQAPSSERVEAARQEKAQVDARLLQIHEAVAAARGHESAVYARNQLQAALTQGRCGTCGRDFSVGFDQVAAHGAALARVPALDTRLLAEQQKLQAQATRLEAYLQGAGAAPRESFPVSAQDIQQHIDRMTRDFAMHEATLRTYRRIDELRTQQDHTKAFARDCGTFAEEASETIRTTLEAARDRFVLAVNRRLSGKSFHLELTETVDGASRPVCRLGLLNAEGHLQTALTGSTQVRLTLALAAAVMELTPTVEEEPIVVYLPEDRGFDPDNLSALLHDLRDVPGQVIITSPVIPTHIPDEFRHISIEGAAK
jgi:hypothetical protein